MIMRVINGIITVLKTWTKTQLIASLNPHGLVSVGKKCFSLKGKTGSKVFSIILTAIVGLFNPNENLYTGKQNLCNT